MTGTAREEFVRHWRAELQDVVTKISILNVDDVIRALKKKHMLQGGGTDDLVIEWNENDAKILRKFGVRSGERYLGAKHLFITN